MLEEFDRAAFVNEALAGLIEAWQEKVVPATRLSSLQTAVLLYEADLCEASDPATLYLRKSPLGTAAQSKYNEFRTFRQREGNTPRVQEKLNRIIQKEFLCCEEKIQKKIKVIKKQKAATKKGSAQKAPSLFEYEGDENEKEYLTYEAEKRVLWEKLGITPKGFLKGYGLVGESFMTAFAASIGPTLEDAYWGGGNPLDYLQEDIDVFTKVLEDDKFQEKVMGEGLWKRRASLNVVAKEMKVAGKAICDLANLRKLQKLPVAAGVESLLENTEKLWDCLSDVHSVLDMWEVPWARRARKGVFNLCVRASLNEMALKQYKKSGLARPLKRGTDGASQLSAQFG